MQNPASTTVKDRNEKQCKTLSKTLDQLQSRVRSLEMADDVTLVHDNTTRHDTKRHDTTPNTQHGKIARQSFEHSVAMGDRCLQAAALHRGGHMQWRELVRTGCQIPVIALQYLI
jgi:hypothetical protein